MKASLRLCAEKVLRAINGEQNRRNEFRNVSSEDLERLAETVRALAYFGYKMDKAAEITAQKYCAGRVWYASAMIRQWKAHDPEAV